MLSMEDLWTLATSGKETRMTRSDDLCHGADLILVISIFSLEHLFIPGRSHNMSC